MASCWCQLDTVNQTETHTYTHKKWLMNTGLKVPINKIAKPKNMWRWSCHLFLQIRLSLWWYLILQHIYCKPLCMFDWINCARIWIDILRLVTISLSLAWKYYGVFVCLQILSKTVDRSVIYVITCVEVNTVD